MTMFSDLYAALWTRCFGLDQYAKHRDSPGQMSLFGGEHDVSDEPRDPKGEWTASGKSSKPDVVPPNSRATLRQDETKPVNVPAKGGTMEPVVHDPAKAAEYGPYHPYQITAANEARAKALAFVGKLQSGDPAATSKMNGYVRAFPKHMADWQGKLDAFADWAQSNEGIKLLSIYGQQGTPAVFIEWRAQQVQADEAAEKEAHLRNTTEVQLFKGDKLAKPQRMTADEMAAWEKPGHVVVKEGGKVSIDAAHHDSFEGQAGDRATIRSKQIGAELPEGTVKAKRLVRDKEHGLQVHYLVKPRGKAAEQQYQDKKRLADLESQARLSVDYMTPEQASGLQKQIAELKAKLTK